MGISGKSKTMGHLSLEILIRFPPNQACPTHINMNVCIFSLMLFSSKFFNGYFQNQIKMPTQVVLMTGPNDNFFRYYFLQMFWQCSSMCFSCQWPNPFPISWFFVMLHVVSLANSSIYANAYMRWWTRLALVQLMACHLFSAVPLPEPMLTYC